MPSSRSTSDEQRPCRSRRSLLALLAGVGALAGCTGPGATSTPTAGATPTSASSSLSPSPDAFGGTPTDATPSTDGSPTPRRVEAPRPSSVEAVASDWPSLAYDARNAGRAPDGAGPIEEPRVQWVADAPAGGAAPVVADGTAVALGPKGHVAAVDPADGTVRWRARLPESPGAPVVADGTLYALTYSLSRANAVVAVDLATGERRWSYGEFSEAFGGLTVADGTVYAAVDEAVHAVDAATGERRWRTRFPDAGATHGPVTVADGRVVVPNVDAAVVALDAATGERRWRAGESAVGRLGASLVTAAHGRLYAATGRRHEDSYDAPTLHALDPATGERVASYATEGAGEPGVAATDEGLVLVDRLLDTPDRPAETPVRTQEATPAGTPPTESERPPKPARAYRVPPDLSGTEWRTELPASSWYGSPPAVAGEVACVGSRSGVATALDVSSGETPWTHAFDVPLDLRGPAVVDGVCVFGSSSGLVALAAD